MRITVRKSDFVSSSIADLLISELSRETRIIFKSPNNLKIIFYKMSKKLLTSVMYSNGIVDKKSIMKKLDK